MITAARRPAAALVLLACTLLAAALVGLPTPTAHAAPVEACNTPTKADTSFCLGHDLAVTKAGTTTGTTTTQDAVDIGVEFGNTSTGYRDEAANPRWASKLRFSLPMPDALDPMLARSSQLPDGLLIAGSATACARGGNNDFAGCTAGRGTGVVRDDNVLGCNGVCTVTFGIQRIVNETADLGTAWAKFEVTLDLCIDTGRLLGRWQCDANRNLTQTVTVAKPASGQPMVFELRAPKPTDTAAAIGFHTLALDLDGQSAALASGAAADRTYTILSLPRTCGRFPAPATATAVNNTTATVTKTIAVNGCAQFQEISATSRVVYGNTATISGKMVEYKADGGHVYMVGEEILLRACPTTAVVPCGATPLRTYTNQISRFSFSVKPSRNTRYFIQFGGYDEPPVLIKPNWTARIVNVAPKVTRSVSRSTLASGTSLTISGSVAPKHAGQVVNIQKLTDGVWRAIAKATLSSTSTYSRALTLSGRSGTSVRLRVALPAHSDHVLGYSPSVTITFR